jgi:hypothetical protein
VRAQHNGVDVVIEILGEELAPHPEHHELADYPLPTPDRDARTALRQPHHERSQDDPPRTGRRRGGTAAIIAAAIVLLALVLVRPDFRADSPVPPPAATPSTTVTSWAFDVRSLTSAGSPTLPTSCASSLPPTGDALCQRWDCPIVCVTGREDDGPLAAVTRSP